MDFNINDISYILPLLLIGAGILISLTVDMFSKSGKTFLPWFSALLFFGTAYYSLMTVGDQGLHFDRMLASGGNVNIFYFLFNFGAALVVLLSVDYLRRTGIYYGEYYILLQSAVLGMMMIASARDLVMIFIGLEQMSIVFYILAGINRRNAKSNEASLKYFLLGAFATGFIVYGIALIYGSTQNLSIDVITQVFVSGNADIIYITGILLFIIGFSFKIAAFPFHMWVPDVYQGAPTTVTALMSTTGKAAAFSALLIVLIPAADATGQNIFMPFFAVVAVASMLYGSIVAIAQDDLKRMLAYSSIAHAGYMLIGLASGITDGHAGVIFYLIAYTFMNLGAFGIIAVIEGPEETNLNVQDYAGLGLKYPVLAGLLALFMFALSGIPPFAGFFGKYYVFVAAIKADLTWLAILGVLSSVISVYFYLRVVVVMYFREAEKGVMVQQSSAALLGILISALLVIIMGIAPGSIINLIASFV